MRYLIALAPLALLAACGGNAGTNNNAGNASAPAGANAGAPAEPVPPVTMAPPGPAALPNGPDSQAARAGMVAECTSEASRMLPAGADGAALCNCAVDKVMAGAAQKEATRACGAELGIAIPER